MFYLFGANECLQEIHHVIADMTLQQNLCILFETPLLLYNNDQYGHQRMRTSPFLHCNLIKDSFSVSKRRLLWTLTNNDGETFCSGSPGLNTRRGEQLDLHQMTPSLLLYKFLALA